MVHLWESFISITGCFGILAVSEMMVIDETTAKILDYRKFKNMKLLFSISQLDFCNIEHK